ncbi:MAG: PsiF family protein [Burkholderiaceae bacterium]
MKTTASLAAMALCLSMGLAQAAGHSDKPAAAASAAKPAAAASAPAADAKAPSAQNTKMATCNKEAGEKKGDERKAFMKTCLSAKKVTQQDKMKSCNADAKAKAVKGDERKKFMSECLKG